MTCLSKAIVVEFGLVVRSVCNIMMDLNIFEFIHIYLMVYHVKENSRFFVRYVFQISSPHINVLYPNPHTYSESAICMACQNGIYSTLKISCNFQNIVQLC